ncbi:MAG: type II secretion system protein [Proteobacteria bacterium]|nr:type II secretion system protein [Pseudomonadota bacterium]HQR04204.1 type II secretion system protein [Rhodocyclaceae bacterium]
MNRLPSAHRSPCCSQRGFTLIEAIMVIVITGIVAGMVAVFIKTSIDSYLASVRRADLTDAAELSVRRMTRDVRLALPNSLRVRDSAGTIGGCSNAPGVTCFIELIPTSNGGRYRDVGDGSTGGNVLSYTSTAATSFDVLGVMPALATNALNGNGDYVVVYNLGPGYAPANAYGFSSCGVAPGCNIAQVQSVAGNTVTLASNPFAAQTPPLPSPGSRFHLVPYATRAVTYACPTGTAGPFMRYWGYGFQASQPTSFGAGSSSLLFSNVTCAVDYTTAVLQRNGLLFVKLNITDAASGETITVFGQVHVDNSP